jgi:ubiquinone/menaquinone biosynthesis C-methylase UbiE
MLPRPLIALIFRLLYVEMAWTYDAVSALVSLGQWGGWIRAALPHLHPHGRILELAHGTGHLQAELTRAGGAIYGLDLSPAMGRIAAGRLQRLGLPMRLSRANAEHLPFPSGHFDRVVSTFPTPFILQANVLAEIRRVLSADGLLVIVPFASLDGGGPVGGLLRWLYHITGQNADPAPDLAEQVGRAFGEPLRAAGFSVTVHPHTLPHSHAYVVVARLASKA